MTKRRDSVWWKNNTTVAAYVPREVYDALVRISVERTKTEHEWWSVSRLMRDILVKAIEAEKAHQDLRAALLKATEDRHGRA